MGDFTRKAVAVKLAELAGDGANVFVNVQRPSAGVTAALGGTNVQFTTGKRIHSKYMLLDCEYVGYEGRQKLAFAGAHNLTTSALNTNAETLWRVVDDEVYSKLLANFDSLPSS